MEDYIEKIEVNLFELIKNINNPSILEFGVQNGASTIRFLDLCNPPVRKPHVGDPEAVSFDVFFAIFCDFVTFFGDF